MWRVWSERKGEGSLKLTGEPWGESCPSSRRERSLCWPSREWQVSGTWGLAMAVSVTDFLTVAPPSKPTQSIGLLGREAPFAPHCPVMRPPAGALLSSLLSVGVWASLSSFPSFSMMKGKVGPIPADHSWSPWPSMALAHLLLLPSAERHLGSAMGAM